MPDTSPRFSVLIVNYNGGAYVQGALDSLKQQTFRDFEVILIDNASSDGSVDNLATEGLPAFTLLKQEDNLGFAAGNNLGARHARGRWLALLNPDAVAVPDWLQKVADAADRHPGVSEFACTQYELHRPDHLDGVGDAYLLFGFPWRGGFGHPASALPGTGTCFSPCGASAIIRRDIFEAFHGFDERFFCYCEDVDLGFRMRLAGETCVFLPEAVIHHAGSGLSSKVSHFSLIHGTRNRIWVYWKNMPLLLLVLTLPAHVSISVYLLIRAAMTGTFAPTWKGMSQGIQGLKGLRGKTSAWSTPQRRIGLWRLARMMAWNPFRMSRLRPHVRPLKGE